MATISVSSGSYIRPYRNVRVRRVKIGTSQTVRVGDPLQQDTTADEGDRFNVSASDPTTDRNLLGFAAEAITTTATHNATNDRALVWLATQDAEFLVHCEDAAAIDVNDISKEYGIVNDTVNNIWRLDRSETSAKVFRVLELIDADADVNGRLVVSVIAPERLYGD